MLGVGYRRDKTIHDNQTHYIKVLTKHSLQLKNEPWLVRGEEKAALSHVTALTHIPSPSLPPQRAPPQSGVKTFPHLDLHGDWEESGESDEKQNAPGAIEEKATGKEPARMWNLSYDLPFCQFVTF